MSAEASGSLQTVGRADLSPPTGADVLVGVALRPPVMQWNGQRYTGARVGAIDTSAATGLPGLLNVVREQDFVGVVAQDAHSAQQAVARIRIDWIAASRADAPNTVWRTQATGDAAGGLGRSPGSASGDSADSGRGRPASWRGATPATSDTTDAAEALNSATRAFSSPSSASRITHTYHWPASADTAAAWAVAWWHPGGLCVWCSAAALPLRRDLAALTGLSLDVIRVMGNGQPPHPRAIDAAADATLLSRAVGRAVRVSASADIAIPGARAASSPNASVDMAGASSATMHAPTSAPVHSTSIEAERDAAGCIAAQHISTDGSILVRPSLARLLIGGTGAVGSPDLPPYRFHAASLSAPADGALASAPYGFAQRAAQVFAQESFIDEAAAAAAVDPVDYRLRHLDDDRGAALVRRVADHAGWPVDVPSAAGPSVAGDARRNEASPPTAGDARRTAARSSSTGDAPRTGRGFAYASVIDDTVEPARRSWSAWVADVAVDPVDGSVDITRVVVGHDIDDVTPVAASAPRIEDDVRRTAGQLLQAPAAFDDWSTAGHALVPGVTQDDRGQSTDVATAATTVSVPTGLAWSDAASLPAAAAVANAIYDATGVRLRQPPFNGAAARAALAQAPRQARRRVGGAWLGGIAAAAAGLIATAVPWKAEIAPVTPDLGIYSAAAIDRGRLVAAAGDCVVCHTAPGGAPNAGGLKLDTKFGQIVTTNITPDPETGIGRWSFAAFDRAMRQGVHRDGRQLYPAFPYTSFAKLTDADMQSLYAFLMTQPAVAATPPETKLAFPYSVRPLMAGWNLLFHDNAVYQPDETRSTVWNRGAYLVQGIGHCGACHTPRNALGAEKRGPAALLTGGEAEGWEAPALNALSRSPIPWTEDDFFSYLRTGFSAAHGVAAGPMAPVVQGLAEVPDQDVRAMAVYLASLNPTANGADRAAQIEALERTADRTTQVFPANGERIFEGACAVCHETKNVAPLFGVRPPLALNTNLHSDRPDNLIQVILNGIADPATGDLGYMPAFGGSLDDTQIAELVEYLRARYAPQQKPWEDVGETVTKLREAH